MQKSPKSQFFVRARVLPHSRIRSLKTDRKHRTMIESNTGQWLRKDSDDSDKIITNLKIKRKRN